MPETQLFRFSIDRGGTFTDIYAEVPEEPGYRVMKLLSEDPDHYEDAPREGIRRILEACLKRPILPRDIDAQPIEWIRMGTTVATNALLERTGARCALLITQGFRDLLQIGNQNRPRIFDLEIRKPELLYERVIEIQERIRIVPQNALSSKHSMNQEPTNESISLVQGVTGETVEILQKPNLEAIRQELQALLDTGIRSIAVVCLHAYAYPEHEQQIGQLAETMGFTQISLSSEVMPRVKIVGRGDTTAVDAYLAPHIRRYIETFRSGFSDGLQKTNLLFMRSDGGLAQANHFTGSKAILSGPAGGVVGYAMTAFHEQTQQPVIGFDMGGTSTDVSRYDGHYSLVHETETAGVRIQAPQLDIITVAAGGGSRLFFRNGMFVAGPESAGAHPGPVCYRKNGYLAVTDANLLLGRLLPEFFPKIFGMSGDQPLDYEATRHAFEILQQEINRWQKEQNEPEMSVEEIAYGFLQVANEVMVRPMREISVMRGYDIKTHVLACFGGAGGQHACAIARSLGITKIHIHRFAGILSAYGMGLADVTHEQQEPASGVYQQETHPLFQKRLDHLAQQASQVLAGQGFVEEQIQVLRYLNLRYRGTDTALMILEPPQGDYAAEFRIQYRREFGFELANREILVDDVRVRAIGRSSRLKAITIPSKAESTPPVAETSCYFAGGWQTVPVFELSELGAGETIVGPAILLHDTSTIVIEPECTAQITPTGDVEIDVKVLDASAFKTHVDPIQLAIFSNLFMSIAEQMGRTLQRTAISTNIKERQDFSCAIFDQTGGLVANAPHQPVHLGAMSEAVRQQVRMHGEQLQEGDVLVTNHPISGGSHLPDITVITPVMQDGKPIFFVANRGHHADIGGISPGSMPPFSRTLEEEGACIETFKLVKNGVFQEEGIIELLQAPSRLPRQTGQAPISGTRTLADNLSDLKAQVASNQRGIDLFREMIETYSLEVVQAYMGHIQNHAEAAVRTMLTDLAKTWSAPSDQSVSVGSASVGSVSVGSASVEPALVGSVSVESKDYLDDGSPIALKLTIDPETGEASFDFSNTGYEIWGNCNAPRAVTHSAILYALRCLIQQEIPLNQGCLNPIQILIEEGSLLAPSAKAAVVGGNVLTSQRVVDVILKAFGAAAASQGCMNNLTFGNANFGYYETIGGGAGAGPHWHGQSGVHTHMTNTRITDPEILERRYPVLLREFSMRPNSGGSGRFCGGNGLIREIEFLEPLNVAILSERRVYSPYGLQGGQSGKQGRNVLIRTTGQVLNLGGKNEIQAHPGDRIRIETPGGGGFGIKHTSDQSSQHNEAE